MTDSESLDLFSKRILIVEDSPKKLSDVHKVAKAAVGSNVVIQFAETIRDAETKIMSPWDLIILDVSMNITSSVSGPKEGGHDALGGLRIAHKMYLLGRETKTIIVTAFDAFPSSEARRDRSEILGLEDVQSRAAELLGDFFVGCVRYGSSGWQSQLENFIKAGGFA